MAKVTQKKTIRRNYCKQFFFFCFFFAVWFSIQIKKVVFWFRLCIQFSQYTLMNKRVWMKEEKKETTMNVDSRIFQWRDCSILIFKLKFGWYFRVVTHTEYSNNREKKVPAKLFPMWDESKYNRNAVDFSRAFDYPCIHNTLCICAVSMHHLLLSFVSL